MLGVRRHRHRGQHRGRLLGDACAGGRAHQHVRDHVCGVHTRACHRDRALQALPAARDLCGDLLCGQPRAGAGAHVCGAFALARAHRRGVGGVPRRGRHVHSRAHGSRAHVDGHFGGLCGVLGGHGRGDVRRQDGGRAVYVARCHMGVPRARRRDVRGARGRAAARGGHGRAGDDARAGGAPRRAAGAHGHPHLRLWRGMRVRVLRLRDALPRAGPGTLRDGGVRGAHGLRRGVLLLEPAVWLVGRPLWDEGTRCDVPAACGSAVWAVGTGGSHACRTCGGHGHRPSHVCGERAVHLGVHGDGTA